MGKIVGLTYDLKSDWQGSVDDPVDAAAELDGKRTVECLQKALESAGHKVVLIGGARALIDRIIKGSLKVDIVLNISEGFRGRNRESQVPAILDLYNIPFAGADALTLGVTLDKVMAKKCFIAEGIPTARFFKAGPDDDLEALNTIGFPLFVKTLHEGTSKGINEASRVENARMLKAQVEHINRNYKQPALVEEFIKGTEFTVGVIGNNPPQAMPVVQYAIDGRKNLGNEFYTYAHVAEKSVQYICPAPIDKKLSSLLQELAVRAYKAVDCRDFGRVDFRVDESGHPYVLEINPLPNLSPDDVFVLFAKVKGMTYNQIINEILGQALIRLGLMDPQDKLRAKSSGRRAAREAAYEK
ncbi:MAG: ATP-grasp domain-containing protein [Candidatus Omnitrophica bacterium]|nr:ATP-grasp domain-containing protein [Candidatus Omnitrophota bacterium]MDE2222126.1 ATP-grasp domain-containing protein [Candidatus Omnitrophota bacterium]